MTSESKQKSVKMKAIPTGILLLVIFVGGGIFLLLYTKSHTASNIPTSPAGQKVTAVPTTPIPTPTPSSTPQPLFFDNFSDTSKGWSLGNSAGYTRTLHNNTLTLAATNHKLLTESLPGGTTFSDFMITV